jgi:predicted AAA+ superfamily ATPase
MPYRRPQLKILVARLRGPRRFIQVLAGPRQSGKTTLVRQALRDLPLPSHYASADEPTLQDRVWIEQQWETGRLKTRSGGRAGRAVLVLDEIHKIPGWSASVKRLWDEDAAAGSRLQIVLLGSAPLLFQAGLTESLTGRFETIHIPHWSFAEMRDAFKWSLDDYVYHGGYPGAAPLIREPGRWARYVLDSLIETTVARDILLMARIEKPALLRRLFQLGCDYSGQILAYQKMLGQLQDAGNTTTLAHYLDLLSAAGLLTGLQKFSGSRVRQRGSSPKLNVLNTALLTATTGAPLSDLRADADAWGRLVESAVGAHLVNTARGTAVEVSYWREGNAEVDFVLSRGGVTAAIEVMSGRRRQALPGLAAFDRLHHPRRKLLVGGQGIPLAEFLQAPAEAWVR